jgi:diguanylate cyclase (GGDEF)-like protein
VNDRRIRPIRIVDGPAENPAAGRPEEPRGAFGWMPVMLRLLTLAWAGAIVAALVDAFGEVEHLPFILAMGMTGVLVVAAFLFTREVKENAGSGRADDGDEDPDNDLLTNLPTLKLFGRRLSDEFNRSRRTGRSVSVVLVDVNNLTAVNREYGVAAGDEVLRHVARTIDSTKRYNDVVARLGDDEFGVLLVESGEQGVTAFVDRLEDRLARESAVADVGGRSVSLWAGVCSGSATSGPGNIRPDDVLQAAMADLTRAKQDRERRRRMWLSA